MACFDAVDYSESNHEIGFELIISAIYSLSQIDISI